MRSLIFLLLITFGLPLTASSDPDAHRYCMEVLSSPRGGQEAPALELNRKFRGLVESEKEWDKVVSIVLETWHVACFSLYGVQDHRARDNQMPWVSPGRLCVD